MKYGSDKRLLNATLAAALATLRHGEIIYLADAGGQIPDTLKVPVLDLGIAPGLVSLEQILPVLRDNGDIERAIVADQMKIAAPEKFNAVVEIFGKNRITETVYRPNMYAIRNVAKLIIRTGDCSVHGNVALLGGYPSADIKVIRGTEVGDIKILD